MIDVFVYDRKLLSAVLTTLSTALCCDYTITLSAPGVIPDYTITLSGPGVIPDTAVSITSSVEIAKFY